MYDIKQVQREYKTKLISKKQNAGGFSSTFYEDTEIPDDDEGIRIVKTKHFAMKPMDPEEACLQMELLGHNFFLFQDASSEAICVVYKRNDGSYGLIEAE